MASDWGVVVVVEIETGCGVVAVVAVVAVVVVVVVAVVVAVVVVAVVVVAVAVTRIQHLTPRLRPRAPSTPAELVMPGFVMN